VPKGYILLLLICIQETKLFHCFASKTNCIIIKYRILICHSFNDPLIYSRTCYKPGTGNGHWYFDLLGYQTKKKLLLSTPGRAKHILLLPERKHKTNICLCMYTLMYGYPDWGFSTLFPQLQRKCQGKTRKNGARPTLFLIFVLLYVLFVLCRSLYCLCVYVYCITATGWLPNCS
jgi:hypothetical protein